MFSYVHSIMKKGKLPPFLSFFYTELIFDLQSSSESSGLNLFQSKPSESEYMHYVLLRQLNYVLACLFNNIQCVVFVLDGSIGVSVLH